MRYAAQSNMSCNTGAEGEAVPGSDPVLPPALPQPSLGEKVGSKGGRGSKAAAKPAKAVELPPEIFQRDEPFVLPPAVSKVSDVCSPSCPFQSKTVYFISDSKVSDVCSPSCVCNLLSRPKQLF